MKITNKLQESELIHVKDNTYRRRIGPGQQDYYLKLPCLNCPNTTFRRRADVKTHPNTFCSNDCMKEYRRKNGLLVQHEINKIYEVDKDTIRRFNGTSWSYRKRFKCQYCGKDTYKEIGNTLHFCNNECQSKYSNDLLYKAMSNPTDPNFCYLMGLIATDGCITGISECRIVLHIKDREILVKLQEKFGGTLKDNTAENDFDNTRYSLCNKNFVNYLNSIGITKRKSLTIDMNTYFNQLSSENKWYFLRGCWDGDGYVGLDYKGNIQTGIGSGSEKFMTMVVNFINETFQWNRHVSKSYNDKSDNPMYNVSWSCNKALILITKLYSDTNILGLKRKQSLALPFITENKTNFNDLQNKPYYERKTVKPEKLQFRMEKPCQPSFT